ncbi:MAG: autotransporter assembly complex protein TamA, partial [Desulfobacterales bacterium]
MKIALLMMTLLILPVAAATADEVPDQFELVAVKFTGVESVSKSELAATLSARTPPIWKVWLPSPVLSDEDLEEDRLRIRQFYRNNGYYRTEVAVAVTTVSGMEPDRKAAEATSRNSESAEKAESPSEKLPRVKVTYEITEGPPVLIESIDLAIGGPVKGVDRKILLTDTRLEIGQVFKVAEYEDAKKNIQQTLGNRGYPFAKITGRAIVDPKANQAKLSFSVTPGPLCVFGPTTIDQEGAEVSETVVRRALTYTEGGLYDADKVEASRRNLLKLDVFRIVSIQPDGPPPEEGGPVPMRVRLKSRDRRSVRFGIGYGTEDKLRLQAALTYRNIAGQGGRLTFSARTSAVLKNIQLAYDQPYFLDARNSLNAKAGNELEEPPAYKNRRIFTGVSLSRKLWEAWVLGLMYDLSLNTEESVAADSPLDIEEQQFLDENTLISSIGIEMARDTRNDLLNPKTGSLMGAKIAVAPDFLGSELTFFQPAIDVR